MSAMLGISHRASTIEEIAQLADKYADQIIDAIDGAEVEELRQGLAGSYLAFLSEAVLLANSVRGF